jgi:uncharacterized protein YlxP (DUF503 family)
MHVAILTLELHLPEARSLKDKRRAIKPIVEGSRRRFSVAVAEVGHQDACHLATIGVAAVSGSAGHVQEVLDAVERFVWSFPEVEVSSSRRGWMNDEYD